MYEDDIAALTALTASLHLTDLAELNHSAKGKGRLGDLSDEQLAFETYREELEAADQVESDRRFALSFETAGRQDRDVLDILREEEDQARRDREIAVAVSQGRPFPRSSAPSTSTNRIGTPRTSAPSTRATSLTRPSTASTSTSSSQPPVASSSAIQVNCVICGDRTRSSNAVQVPCKYQHHYCTDCLRNLFLSSTRDESLFPPRCDGTIIPLSLAQPHLGMKQLTLFRAKSIEFSTTNRLYCSTQSCSAFLGEANNDRKGAVRCENCQADTCRACKAPWHGLFGLCAAGADDEAAAILKNERGYQRCPGCRRMVELDVGCFHMTCLCSRQFCYLCAADWKTCNCLQWDENLLLRAAQNRVRAEEQARPRDRDVLLPDVPRANAVARVVEQLRVNHECEHEDWYLHGAGGQYASFATLFGVVHPISSRTSSCPRIDLSSPSGLR
ncbi:hypothetical protein JCM11641_005200 [Rhodosporidiobolus odoratus]